MPMALKARNQNRNRDPCFNSCKRICDLPDDLLGRILGMLPMKDAVRTSVLSTRWEYIWTSLSDLIFDQYECPDRMLFLNFVERALLLRTSSSIRVFSLRSALHKDDASRIEACLDAAVRCNVQDLKLRFYSHVEPSALPFSVFRCEMLTQLDLCFPDTLRVPSSVRFSSLKHLTLEYVKFVDDISAENMFSGAALERLCLNKCSWAKIRVLNISAPKLWSLSVNEAQDHGSRGSICDCKIVIHGSSLKYFCSLGWLLYDYTISSSSMPVEAIIELYHVPDAWSHPVDRWRGPFKGLKNVKFLTLRGLSFQINSLPHDALPVFHNLVKLKLSFRYMCLGSPTLAAILRRSPHLERIDFTQGLRVVEKLEDQNLEDGILDPPPPCLSSSLKRITIYVFFGTESEMLALRILLRIATVLEEIVIWSPGDHPKGFDEDLIQDMAELAIIEHRKINLDRNAPIEEQEGSEEYETLWTRHRFSVMNKGT